MRKSLILFVAAMLFASLTMAGIAFADDAKGAVKSVDAKAGTISINTGKEVLTLKADKDTIAKFKAKDTVKVTYDKASGTVKTIAKDRGAKVPVGC